MQHTYQRRVHFADTDAAGVVHFSTILCYAEEAEHDLLASLDIPLLKDGGWPRVSVHCDYLAPLKAMDLVDVSLSIERIGESSLTWAFTINAGDKQVAVGTMTSVRVGREGKVESISPSWRESLTDYELSKESS